MVSETILKSLLLKEDKRIIEMMAQNLQVFSDVSQSDVFIDCFLPNAKKAIVIAEAHPKTARSLYQKPVMGKIALPEKEPGIFDCYTTGIPVHGARGITQENVNMQQNVQPIKSASGKVIGVLIMEQDITEKVHQEMHVEHLIETNEQLSGTLFNVAMAHDKLPALIHEGVILFNQSHQVTYLNESAERLLGKVKSHLIIGQSIESLFPGFITMSRIKENRGFLTDQYQLRDLWIEMKAVSIEKKGREVGGLLLMRDLSEMKKKEKELMLKSTVIQEIHHRVKNNLQTISSLLRLQMRRSHSNEVKEILKESINRIMSISVVHDLLNNNGLELLSCKDILENVVNGVVQAMRRSDQQIDVTVESTDVFLGTRLASSLAVVVNELVQNALKHAFINQKHGRIDVQLTNHNGVIQVVVSDNGVGFEACEEHFSSNQLGLDICNAIVKDDLKGTLLFHGDTYEGTLVTIAFPEEEVADG